MRALAWLYLRLFRNALVRLLRRMREPLYLLFGLVVLLLLSGIGVAIFSGSATASLPRSRDAVHGLLTLLLLWATTSAWWTPKDEVLAFSIPEVFLLFPSPIPRRAILRMRVLRAQVGIGLLALIFALSVRHGLELRPVPVFAGMVCYLNAVHLNRMAGCLCGEIPGGVLRTRVVPYAMRAALAVAVAVVVFTFPLGRLYFTAASHVSFDGMANPAGFLGDLLDVLAAWAQEPAPRFALAPFRALTRPLAAPDSASLASALPFALALLAPLYLLVVHNDAPFEEVALASGQRVRERYERFLKTGRLGPLERTARSPIALPSFAGPTLALAWKDLLGASRTPPWRFVAGTAALLAVAVAATRLDETSWACGYAAILFVTLAVVTVGFAPETSQHDLRALIRKPHILKTVPLAGWKIVLGETIANAAVALYWEALLLGVAAILVGAVDGAPDAAVRFASWLGAVIFLAPANLLLCVVTCGAFVCFPAWMPRGPRTDHPVNLIQLFGLYLVLFARLIFLFAGIVPATLLAVLAGLLGWAAAGAAALPVAGLLGATVLVVEVGLLVHLVGPEVDRLDPSLDL